MVRAILAVSVATLVGAMLAQAAEVTVSTAGNAAAAAYEPETPTDHVSATVQRWKAAREKLRAEGAAALPEVIPLLDDPDTYHADTIASMLGSLGPAAESAVPAIVKLIRAQERALWRAPMNRKGELRSIEALKRILPDPKKCEAALAQALEVDDPITEVRDTPANADEYNSEDCRRGTAIWGDFNNDGRKDVAIMTDVGRGNALGPCALFLGQHNGKYRYVGDFAAHPDCFQVTPKAKGTSVLECYHSLGYEISSKEIIDLGESPSQPRLPDDDRRIDKQMKAAEAYKKERFGPKQAKGPK